MANIEIKNGSGTTRYLKASGAGSEGDPHVPEQAVTIASLPLPNNAATQTTLAAIQTLIDSLTTPSDTQPVSAASLPLPTGAATEATLSAIETLIDSLTTPSDTQPISAANLPLPTGAATASNQSTGNGHLATLAGAVDGTEVQADVVTLPALPAGTNDIGTVNLPDASAYRSISVLATGQVVKASAGKVYGYYLYNNGGSTNHLKIYDKATAPDQADTPALTIPLPAGSAANLALPTPLAFASGIGIRATTGVADNDTVAPSANDVVVNIIYI